MSMFERWMNVYDNGPGQCYIDKKWCDIEYDDMVFYYGSRLLYRIHYKMKPVTIDNWDNYTRRALVRGLIT